MKRHQSEWPQLVNEHALACVVYQLAREAVARRSHDKATMTAALLIEAQAREKLVEVRRRMYKVRLRHDRRLTSAGSTALQLST
jgi:hypothetical protein